MTFLGVLALILITLKLTSVIAWSWWLVLLPLYGGFTLWVIVAVIVMAFAYLFNR